VHEKAVHAALAAGKKAPGTWAIQSGQKYWAAYDAAYPIYRAHYDEHGFAFTEQLKAEVAKLQTSFGELIKAMCEVGRVEVAA